MKISYLILAHHQPKQLFRLVKTLNSEHVSFFIYIDLKSDISQFNCYDYGSNVFFIKNRVSVNRFGYSQPQAMINLIRTAAASNEYDYFIFMSGNDYPIKDNNYIYNYLKNNYPINFINFYPLVGSADFVNNIKKYYFIDLIKDSPKYINIPLRFIRFMINKLFPNRSFIKGIIPYRGSTSWCLNRQTINYIVEYLKSPKSKKYVKYFKSVWAPDEIFFQTLVLNSPYAKQCRFYERDILNSRTFMKNENKAYLHYIDWSRDREDPAVLDMRDYELLKDSDLLFGRKFFEHKSDELLDKIDKNLLNTVCSPSG
jgi:Core-2/I-Branching enzyme